ncbi:MAG: RidA family protein [Brevinemataceae bacterium]
MKKSIHSSNAPKAIGPYSQAIEANGTIYISGQIPVNPSTGEIPQDIKSQTTQSMENIKAILTECGLDCSHIVRCGIFLKSMNDFSVVNEVYSTYFSEPFPARATVEVSRLPKDVLVEIDVIAIR